MIGEAGISYLKSIKVLKKTGSAKEFLSNSDFFFAPFTKTPYYLGLTRSDGFEGNIKRLCDILEENYDRERQAKESAKLDDGDKSVNL